MSTEFRIAAPAPGTVRAALLFAMIATTLIHAPNDPPPPPDPVQCKQVGMTNVCRYPDGSVQACSPLGGCHPVSLVPEIWDR